MNLATQKLLGTHDFSSFCNQEGLVDHKTLCTLYSIEIKELPENRLAFQVIGNRFLFRMMRILVGTLVYVGLGKFSQKEITSILSSKKREKAGITAPARGLYLTKVFY